MSRTSTSTNPSRPSTHAHLISSEASLELAVFVDSGADESLMDWGLAKQLQLTLEPLPVPQEATALDGHLLFRVTHRTPFLRLIMSGNHSEMISFLIIDSPEVPLILGHPWLRRHNPHINWSSGLIMGWSEECYSSCLVSASPTSPKNSDSSSDFPDLSAVPPAYLDLNEVFNKSRASSLPPHRPYDCAIDLLPGTSPPKGRLYSLSGLEMEVMNKYVQDSLAAGIIRPSSSPAGAGFLFVDKKDKSLRPCIDYRGLSDITVKNRYPLPLISSAFELLQGHLFSLNLT